MKSEIHAYPESADIPFLRWNVYTDKFIVFFAAVMWRGIVIRIIAVELSAIHIQWIEFDQWFKFLPLCVDTRKEEIDYSV